MFRGSIVALVTPMTTDNEIDDQAWTELLDWHLESGTDGVVVAGTTGESATLSAEEFGRLLSLAVERISGKVPVLAGTGFPSTAQTIERTRLASRLGADAALVVTPAYIRPPQRGLEAHFRAVADAAPVPVVLYNVPSRTAVDLAPETSLRLAEHDNIVAIKEAVGDAERVNALISGGLAVLSGDDPSCCERMLAGAQGVISVAANIVPRQMARLCELSLSGQVEAARAEDARLEALYRFLGIESNPVPAKWMLQRMGRTGPGIRLPLVGLDERYHAQAESLMRSLKLDAVADVA
jgi:4-hydroxy-tetrahydrodipicolinate synthase